MLGSLVLFAVAALLAILVVVGALLLFAWAIHAIGREEDWGP